MTHRRTYPRRLKPEERERRLADYRTYLKDAIKNPDSLLVGAYPGDFLKRQVEQGEVIRGPERYVLRPLTVGDALGKITIRTSGHSRREREMEPSSQFPRT